MTLDDEKELHLLKQQVQRLGKRLFMVELLLADLPHDTLKELAQAYLKRQEAVND